MTDSTRQVIKAVALVTGETVAFILILRVLSNPDVLTTARMRLFHSVENVCQRNATAWANAADLSKTLYDNSRSVLQ